MVDIWVCAFWVMGFQAALLIAKRQPENGFVFQAACLISFYPVGHRHGYAAVDGRVAKTKEAVRVFRFHNKEKAA